MKKKVSTFLALSQILISPQSNADVYDDYDFEKYMRNAREVVNKEKNYIIPYAINFQYSHSLSIKGKYIDNTHSQYFISRNELTKNTNEFNQKYEIIDSNNINSLDDFKNLLTRINNASKDENKIKHNVYSYRKAEEKLLEIKDSFKDYCFNTSKLENANALTFEPKKFSLEDIQFKPTQGSFDESIHKDGHVQRPFLAVMASGWIAGAVLSAIGATGVGLIVIVVAAVAAYFTALFVNSYKQNEEEKKYKEFKKKVQRKFDEATEWYKQNSILYKPDEIKKMAYEICTIDKPFQLSEELNSESQLFSAKKTIDNISQNLEAILNQMREFNGNIEYTKETSTQLVDLFSLNSGVIPIENLANYNDKVTLNYVDIIQKLNNLNKNIYQVQNNLANKFAKKDMEEIQNKLSSDSKLIAIQNTVFSEIRDKKVKELFKIFIDFRDNCNLFSNLTDEITQEIDIVVNNTLKNNVDKYNKNHDFITIKLPKMLEVTKNYTNFRKKLVCGEQ
jgi:hypothetical protein